VTSRRHRHYKRALRWIDTIDPERAGTACSQLLRELAQDLLLAREAGPDCAELEAEAAVALDLVRANGVISRSHADEIWAAIRACGPRARSADRSAEPLIVRQPLPG
jgi:hypothetical protein